MSELAMIGQFASKKRPGAPKVHVGNPWAIVVLGVIVERERAERNRLEEVACDRANDRWPGRRGVLAERTSACAQLAYRDQRRKPEDRVGEPADGPSEHRG